MGSESNIRKFSDFLVPNNILCGMDIADAYGVRSRLFGVLKIHYPELDIAAAAAEVAARETVFPTIVAPGLAVPHARLAGLKEPLIAMACSPKGIPNGEGGEPTVVTVLMLTPLDNPNLHLQILSALAVEFSSLDRLKKVAALTAPAAVISELQGGHQGNGEGAMPAYLKASDVMTEAPVTLLETDSLGHAIRLFATTQCEEFAVLDSSGDLRGVMSLSDLLHHSLPEHLLWMENLSPIYEFQPFAELLKTSEQTKVADVMREDFLTVESDVPAIQLAKLFLVNGVSRLIITKNGKFAGMVELKSFCARLFWE